MDDVSDAVLLAEVERLRNDRERALNAYEDEHRRATQLQERVTHLEAHEEELREARDEADRESDHWQRCNNLAVLERDEARAEVERLRALMIEMWDNAEDWYGPRASSHYRSEIATRVGKGPSDGAHRRA